MAKKSKGLGKFLFGAGIGAGLAVFLSSDKGKATMNQLKLKLSDLYNKASKLDKEGVKEEILKKLDELKEELEDLDTEKVLKIAKQKAVKIQDIAEDLVEYIVEKGTPVLEKSANIIRSKAILATKEVLKRLEQEEK